jgi:hypothetical protein
MADLMVKIHKWLGLGKKSEPHTGNKSKRRHARSSAAFSTSRECGPGRGKRPVEATRSAPRDSSGAVGKSPIPSSRWAAEIARIGDPARGARLGQSNYLVSTDAFRVDGTVSS